MEATVTTIELYYTCIDLTYLSYRHNYRTLLYLHWPYLLDSFEKLPHLYVCAMLWSSVVNSYLNAILVEFQFHFLLTLLLWWYIVPESCISMYRISSALCEPLFVVSCRYSFKHFVMHVKESKLTILLMICMEQFDLQCF